MNIKKELEGKTLKAQLEGNLDTITSVQFENEIIPFLNDIDLLVLDFQNLSYVSSAGLRVLLVAQKKMEQKGKMVIKNVNEEIREIFDMTGFINFLTII